MNQGEAPTPDDRPARDEISRRWDAQIRLDEAVAAIRSGDANRAIALAEDPALANYGPSAMSGLLGQMVRSGHPVMLDYVRATLNKQPTLTQERYAGRTLLHQ